MHIGVITRHVCISKHDHSFAYMSPRFGLFSCVYEHIVWLIVAFIFANSTSSAKNISVAAADIVGRVGKNDRNSLQRWEDSRVRSRHPVFVFVLFLSFVHCLAQPKCLVWSALFGVICMYLRLYLRQISKYPRIHYVYAKSWIKYSRRFY